MCEPPPNYRLRFPKSATNPAQAVRPTDMCGPSGRVESRTPTVAARSATSTHSVPLPPLYDDLNQ